ncbi:hypothetical protein NC652_028399 [Populus alba x Populus x berolinensis]|nr:hypothetical protein NC652_028399 [Populus alba x Populus x berolinensis]
MISRALWRHLEQPFVLGSLEVVLCFEDNDVVHVNGKVDPKWDFDVITLEHVFSDLEQEDAEKSAMERIRDALMDGKPARSVTLT